MNSSPTRKHSLRGADYRNADSGPQYRICSKCKKERLVEQFYDDGRRNAMCKDCRKKDVNGRYARRKIKSVSGNPDGKGRIDYPDGAAYVGDLQGGNRHGKGVYYFPDGRKMKGSWSENLLEV